MRAGFVFYIAFRYLKAQRKTKKQASSLLSIVGIATGVMTLTVVIGVMNGFQLGFIEPLINIGSYHIQIKGQAPLDSITIERIKAIPGVTALVQYAETQAILQGGFMQGGTVCFIRGIPSNVNELDPSFSESFYVRGFDIPQEDSLAPPDSLLLGSQLAIRLNANRGDEITVTTLNGLPFMKMRVSGIFQTWYLDIDSEWAFTSIESSRKFYSKAEKPRFNYGIKVKDRFNETRELAAVKSIISNSGCKASSWREYNPAFFSVLFNEKVMMMVLIGLIFVVVGFNIFHSQKRSVLEKKEEIGILKAIGATPFSIRNIFLFEGFLIGAIGSAVGILTGLFLAYNINELFRLTEFVVNNLILENLERLLDPFLPGLRFDPVYIFSTRIFYIDKIHTRILLPEVVFMCFAAIASSTFAALFASGKITDIKPKDVLRYE